MPLPAAAAQLGILAACVVLFVPMGLAGLHLSRNKVLFFGGALFISLAVIVHLSPYLPSLLGPASPSSLQRAPLPLSCLASLHSLHFVQGSFEFSRSEACHFDKIPPSDALDLLNGSWILAAGDSQTRLLVLALLRLLLDPAALAPAAAALARRHSDYRLDLPSHALRLDFLWSPFEPNVSSSLRSLGSGADGRFPDVLLAGSGLWHMLHVNNAADYGVKLGGIEEAAKGLELSTSSSSSHMFWVGMPTLIDEMLNTEEKRARMNETVQERYRAEVDKSGMLRRNGGTFLLLDVGFLSRECGQECTEDGMHYNEVVYDAAVQVMLNALLIETQQRV